MMGPRAIEQSLHSLQCFSFKIILRQTINMQTATRKISVLEEERFQAVLLLLAKKKDKK